MPGKFFVGTVYRPSKLDDQAIADSLNRLIGAQTELDRLNGLAGDNDLLQILADSVTWVTMLKALGLGVISGIGKKIGEETYIAIKRRFWDESPETLEPSATENEIQDLKTHLLEVKSKDHWIDIGYRTGLIASARNLVYHLENIDDLDRGIAALAIAGPWAEDLIARQTARTINEEERPCAGKITWDGANVLVSINFPLWRQPATFNAWLDPATGEAIKANLIRD